MPIHATVFKIYNSSPLLADTEASQQLSEGAAYFEIKCRDLTSTIKVSFVATQSGVTYFTIPAGSTWYTKGVIPGQKTLYFQSPQAGAVVEIIEAF